MFGAIQTIPNIDDLRARIRSDFHLTNGFQGLQLGGIKVTLNLMLAECHGGMTCAIMDGWKKAR